MTNTKKMTRSQMEQMVGCSVWYRGYEWTIESAHPDTQMLVLVGGGMTAIIRPSEIR